MIWLLTHCSRIILRFAAFFARALGRRLPGEIPTFKPPTITDAECDELLADDDGAEEPVIPAPKGGYRIESSVKVMNSKGEFE